MSLYPKHYVPVSKQGFTEGDYAMILGNPGSTDRYASSFAIKNRVNNGNNARIEMRGVKQNAWKEYMLADEESILLMPINMQAVPLLEKQHRMNHAIKKLNVIADKEKQEAEFAQWVNADTQRVKKYGGVLPDLKRDYTLINKNQHAIEYLRESLLYGVELPGMALSVNAGLNHNMSVENNLNKVQSIYKDYYPKVDRHAFAALLEAYRKAVPPDALPDVYKTIDKNSKVIMRNM